MFLYQLNYKVVNLLNIADTLNKFSKLTKRDSSLITTLLHYYYKGVVVYRV